MSAPFQPPRSSRHLDRFADKHVIVHWGSPGPGGVPGVAQMSPPVPTPGCAAPRRPPIGGEAVQVAKGGVALGVHDGVHVLGPADHAQLGHALVGRDHELHPRTAPTRRSAVPGRRAPPARRGPIGLRDPPFQAEQHRPEPPQTSGVSPREA